MRAGSEWGQPPQPGGNVRQGMSTHLEIEAQREGLGRGDGGWGWGADSDFLHKDPSPRRLSGRGGIGVEP